MAKDKLGPGFKRFEFRPGVGGFPAWTGLDLRGDPAAIAPNALRVAKNVRFLDRDLVSRSGQALTAAGMGGVLGIFDSTEDGGASGKLWGFPYGPEVVVTYTYEMQVPPVSNMGADLTLGYLYGMVKTFADGIFSSMRLYRLDKTYAGVPNLYTTVSGDFIVVNLTTGASTTLVATYTPSSIGTYFANNGTLMADVPVSDIVNWEGSQIQYADNGVVYFNIFYDTGTGPHEFYRYTSGTGVTDLLKSYPIKMYSANRFWKIGAQIVGLISDPSTFDVFKVYIINVPTFTGPVQINTASFLLGGSSWSTGNFPILSSGWKPVFGSNLYLPGQLAGNSKVIKVDSAFAQTVIDTGASGIGANFTFTANGRIYFLYDDSGVEKVGSYDGAIFSAIGNYGAATDYSGGAYIHSDDRFFARATGGAKLLIRSGVADYVTAFADFDTAAPDADGSQQYEVVP